MMRPSWLPANDSRLRWMPSWPRPAPTWPRSGGKGTTPVRPNAGGLQRGSQALGTGQGAWDYVVGTVETAMDLAVLMYKTDREIKEWTQLLLTGDRNGLDRKIAAMRAAVGKVMAVARRLPTLATAG